MTLVMKAILSSLGKRKIKKLIVLQKNLDFRSIFIVKFSPERKINDSMFLDHHQEDSRRYTIDNFSRSAASNAVNTSMKPPQLPQLNKVFNTVSENEFEAVTSEHKTLSFHLEPTGNINRLSTLQIRNKQAKPHLQSSYPLEMNLPTENEDQIRGAQQQASYSILKEKSNTPSQPSTSKMDFKTKRKIDTDTNDQNSAPKKTHMVWFLSIFCLLVSKILMMLFLYV